MSDRIYTPTHIRVQIRETHNYPTNYGLLIIKKKYNKKAHIHLKHNPYKP